MQKGVQILSAASGEQFDRDFIGPGEIIVRREGHSRARHLFTVNGRTIARLRWRSLRRATYETDEARFELTVGALDKRISIVAEDGGESFLFERSRANPNREGIRVEMAEGDNFLLSRQRDSQLRSEVSFVVHKEFYNSKLLVCHFNTRWRTQTTVRIDVNPVMKWEARFMHRLVALIACRIILERRHSGSQPLKLKEHPKNFSSSSRVRDRKRVW